MEWSLWIGRPLLGQWVHDLLQLADWDLPVNGYDRKRVAVIGWGEAGLASLAAGALDTGIRGAAALETLASFVGDGAPHAQRMVAFSPDLLHVGDVSQLAMLLAPRGVLVSAPLRLDGMPASASEIAALYRETRAVYQAEGAAARGQFAAAASLSEITDSVLSWLAGKTTK